jgi:hypothetical protein
VNSSSHSGTNLVSPVQDDDIYHLNLPSLPSVPSPMFTSLSPSTPSFTVTSPANDGDQFDSYHSIPTNQMNFSSSTAPTVTVDLNRIENNQMNLHTHMHPNLNSSDSSVSSDLSTVTSSSNSSVPLRSPLQIHIRGQSILNNRREQILIVEEDLKKINLLNDTNELEQQKKKLKIIKKKNFNNIK